jgi:4-hydroxybenzoyl-CoA thioesterase
VGFETAIKVRFGDVDGAGIVFYPRYFEMLNTAIEEWCDRILLLDFHDMHLNRGMGIPVVRIAATFTAPSVLGDVLSVTIVPRLLGTSSCTLEAGFSCAGEARLGMDMTIVCMDLAKRRGMAWPPEIRERIAAAIAQGEPS